MGAHPRARELAHRILMRVESGGYSGILLQGLPEGMEARERALVTELVLGTLRWQGRIDHGLAQCSRRPLSRVDPPVLAALRMGAHQILHLDRVPASAAVNESVELVRRQAGAGAAGFANAVLRAVVAGKVRWPGEEADPLQRLSVETSHPPWLVRRWSERLGGEEVRRALEAHNRPAPVTLRVNGSRTNREGLRCRLESEGVVTAPGRWSPEALQVTSGNPTSGAAFREGLAYLQDEASMLVSGMVEPQAGDRVADLCAAPGGKATHLAEKLQGRGLLVASDLHLRRLRLTGHNSRRLGLAGIRLLCQDSARPAVRPGALDRALLDAPCTGTGVLRRRPEIRWRRTPEDLLRLASLQSRLLEAAAELVRPGGVLVYSVCSVEPEEGPALVERFLQARPDYAALPPPGVPEELVERDGGFPYLRTWPHRHDLDGFFAAALQRSPAGAASLAGSRLA
jgi:16S rRNA (cytosine967-C5)-methyltransferase